MLATKYDQFSMNFGALTPPSPPPRQWPRQAIRHMLYYAVLPEREEAMRAADTTMELKKELALSGQLVPPELMHVSLVPVGTFLRLPEDVVFALKLIAARIQIRPFTTEFNRYLTFKHGEKSSSLVLCCDEGNAELKALYHDLSGAIADTRWALNMRKQFTPHMTQLRSSSFAPETPLRDPLTWSVREFVLVHSVVGMSLHRYLGRWPLLG